MRYFGFAMALVVVLSFLAGTLLHLYGDVPDPLQMYILGGIAWTYIAIREFQEANNK